MLFCLLCAALGGCASQFATSYVGRTAVDLELELGQPVNVVDLGDGRRSYQYYWGGGTIVMPQTTTGSVSVVGNTATMQSTTMPSAVIDNPGCLINFIAEPQGSSWVIVEARWPQRVFC